MKRCNHVTLTILSETTFTYVSDTSSGQNIEVFKRDMKNWNWLKPALGLKTHTTEIKDL